MFGEHGAIISAVVMRDADGKSKCFGFVNFENADDAAQAVEALNGEKFGDEEWYVGKAQKKSEREQELKSRFENNTREAVDKYQGVNLYVKNLDDSIDDDKLKGLFSEFGTVVSCKIMQDPSGVSRGSGFVAFTTPEEASRALSEMNGKMLISKQLYVALAQRKGEKGKVAGTVFPIEASCNATINCSSYANVSSWCTWHWTATILWASSPCYNSSGWIWLSAAACTWHASWWSSYAKLLCATGPSGPTPR